MKKKLCPHCKKEITSGRSDRVWCSTECYWYSMRDGKDPQKYTKTEKFYSTRKKLLTPTK